MAGLKGGIRLDSCLAGNRRCTSREAVQRFMKALTEADEARRETPTPPSKVKLHQEQRAEQAARILSAMGVRGVS
jgi:hypothetical protein